MVRVEDLQTHLDMLRALPYVEMRAEEARVVIRGGFPQMLVFERNAVITEDQQPVASPRAILSLRE